MECTEWSGLALNQPCWCENGPPCERFVAFQSIDTGRRFLACAKKVSNMTLVIHSSCT